jgi:hypothetical protein
MGTFGENSCSPWVVSGHLENVLIAIGATKYTPLRESTFLQPGDRAIVRVYDTSSDV